MPKIHHAYTQNFTIIANQVVQDTTLSYKARGLFLYLWHLPDDWEISLRDLQNHSTHDGQGAVRTGVAELERRGYLSFRRVHALTGGKFVDTEWALNDMPSLDFPKLAEPKLAEPKLAEPKLAEPKLDNYNTPKYYPPKNCKEERTQKEIKTDPPPISPPGGDNSSPQAPSESSGSGKKHKRLAPLSPSPAEQAVLTHLNTVHGRTFSNTGEIHRLLQAGRTVAECLLVIDWCWAIDRVENPDGYERYFNTVTPFRPANFDRLLDRAKRWHRDGRPLWRARTLTRDEQRQAELKAWAETP